MVGGVLSWGDGGAGGGLPLHPCLCTTDRAFSPGLENHLFKVEQSGFLYRQVIWSDSILKHGSVGI